MHQLNLGNSYTETISLKKVVIGKSPFFVLGMRCTPDSICLKGDLLWISTFLKNDTFLCIFWCRMVHMNKKKNWKKSIIALSQWQFLTVLQTLPVDWWANEPMIWLTWKLAGTLDHTLITDPTFFILLINMRHAIYFKKSWRYQNFPKNLNWKLPKNQQ